MDNLYFMDVDERFSDVEELTVLGKKFEFDQKDLMELYFEREDTGDVQLNIISDSTVTKAHRGVLISGSDYFKAMFRCDFMEATENEVNIPDYSAVIVEAFIKFLYTGEIHIDEENFEEVFNLANQMQVSSLISLCIKVSTRELNWDNFEQHYSDALDLALTSTCGKEQIEVCHNFLAQNFNDLLRNRQLLRRVPAEAMMTVLSRDDLCVANEDDLVEIVINWVKVDPKGREPALTHLYDQIRLAFVSMRELRRLGDAFDNNPGLKMKTLRRVISDSMKGEREGGKRMAKPRLYYKAAATPYLNYDGEDEPE